MSCKNYIVTAQKATAVSHSITGHFTSESDRNLIIAKHSTLELHTVCPEGLKSIKEINIYGKISVLLGFRPSDRRTDLIFMLTMKKDAMILDCQGDESNLKIVTLASGNVHERIGKLADNGPLGIVDPAGRIAALRIYEGLLKIIPLSLQRRAGDCHGAGPEPLKAFNVRVEEMDVIDIAFVEAQNPTIAYIYQDHNGRHLKAMEVNLQSKDLTCVAKVNSIELQASMLIPLPGSHPDVVIVGQEVITAQRMQTTLKTIAPPVIRTSPMLAYEQLDANRFLLGDMAGRLFMLFIEREDSSTGVDQSSKIRDMKVELLGEISIPESISYLDNGVVYVGSRFGDCQLVRLSSEPDDSNNYLQQLESFTNLGPIVDMAVVDTDKQGAGGQGQLVTCSGAYKDGSLRVIRSGVGINEFAIVDLEGLKGVFALRWNGAECDNLLLITNDNQSRTLRLTNIDEQQQQSGSNGSGAHETAPEIELEEVQLDGFESNQPTYHCQTVVHDQTLQVTPSSARLIGKGGGLVSEWRPPEGHTVSVCTSNTRQLLIACRSELFLLIIGNGELTEASRTKLSQEAACLDLSPLSGEEAEVAAVALWVNFSAVLLKLPDLKEICTVDLDVVMLARGIMLAKFDSGHHLFVALGDGSLLHYTFEGEDLTQRKRVCVGTQPMKLVRMGQDSVFACTDRPAIAHCRNAKLVVSHVNLREVKHMNPLKLAGNNNCVVLITKTQIIFGTIDNIQKLHIRSKPLGESPKRIAHQPETGTLGLLTMRVDLRQEGSYQPARTSISLTASHQSTVDGSAKLPSATGATGEAEDELEAHSFVLMDDVTLEATHALHFPSNPSCNEMALSIMSGKLGTDPAPYYVIGTAYIKPGESEPTSGRLIVLQYSEGASVTKVSERELKGAPYSICNFNGRVLACVNSSVRLFEWNESKRELHLESTFFNNIMALYLKTKGDFALVGDLMRSMSLLLYKPVETCLEEIARDHSPNWMFAVEIIDDDAFLGADNCGNLFVCARESDAASGEERIRLQETGRYHLGDNVNVFQHGALVMQQLGERAVPTTGSILYGTMSGAVGIVCQLPDQLYKFLHQLQLKLLDVIVGVGGVEHSKFRSFDNEQKVEPALDFIDGDLIESALDLDKERLELLAKDLEIKTDFSSAVSESAPCTGEDLIKIVEELARMH